MKNKSICVLIMAALLLWSFNSCSSGAKAKVLTELSGLSENLGKTVTIVGKVSNVPWQHMINFQETHPAINYFDVGGGQTVVYSKEAIACPANAKVTGKVIEVGGKSKRPSAENMYKEYQIVADLVKCQ